MYNTPLHYGSYVYPRWGKALGVCMGATCCLQILIWAIVAISRETGTLKDVSTTYYILLRHPVSVRSGYTSATVRNNNTLLLLFTYRRRQMKWNLLCRRVSDCLLGFFFFVAAFPEINSTSEFLEGKQLEQRWESGGAHGARQSGSSVHRHPHRHGLYCDEVGDGKPGVTARRAAANTMLSSDRGIYYDVICPSEALEAEQTVCPAGQCVLMALFII